MEKVEGYVQGWAGVAFAGIAGASLPLAFAPFDWALVALVAPAALFYIAACAPHKRALQAGYVFGLGMFGVGASWVFVSINEYGGAGLLLSGLVTAGFVALLAVFPLGAVWLSRWITSSTRLRLLLVLPAAWVLLEWVRTWLFTGFPWLFLGYAALDTPLAGFAPLVGVLGTSVVIAWLAGWLAMLLVKPGKYAFIGVLSGLIATIAVGAFADRSWSTRVGEPIEAVLLQGNHPQELKWRPAYRQTIRNSYAQLTKEHLGADLIIWPETSLPELFENVDEGFLRPLAEQVREAGGALLVGIPWRDKQREGEPLYNAVVVFGGAGPNFYTKRHLVPYGEYVPLREFVGRSLDFLGAPLADYVSGPKPEAVAVNGLKLGITICYEVAYPLAVARGARGSDMLVNVSNDAWFGDSLAPHQHLQKARQRAAEMRRWMLRATNTGITAVINPYGEVVKQGERFVETSVAAEVEKRRGQTPYMVMGDWPVVILVSILLLARPAWRVWKRG